ncbi:AHH domain-containing protein [Hyalangium gracile]|uniref:AHH domain-containing protein n=1 Tax=Hyalangium gracile TaxID=394092 RepID=UPI001CCA14B9|nr:AHH domain-containing protein [Hyalangium gracile]
MKSATRFLRLLLILPLALPASCATAQSAMAERGQHDSGMAKVVPTWLSEDQLQLDFEPLPPRFYPEMMSAEEAQAVLAAFARSFPESEALQVLPARASSTGAPAPWEARLRAEFLKHYGTSRLPLPGSIQHSPLFMALRLSPRYMGPGIREAAQQMFRSPVFLASVALSVLVYFAAWTLPEPLFSKAFAATLTARLALLVGLVELRNVALACLQLYRDAQAARTRRELEAIAERFGRALGGTALRVVVAVASFGVAKGLPNVPSGGLGALLGPPRYAMAGGGSFHSASAAHIVADGTIVLAGAVLGTVGSSMSSACTDGSQKREGYQWHHLATNKNELSATRGGPWTPLFQQIFAKAGMGLDDPANRVYLASHRGPHPEEYHAEVYDRLLDAVRDCKGVSHCRLRLTEALAELASKTCTTGSYLHRLLTQKASR